MYDTCTRKEYKFPLLVVLFEHAAWKGIVVDTWALVLTVPKHHRKI